MFTRKELQFPSEPQSSGNIESDIRGWLRYFYDVRKSIQDFFRWLNTPGAINLTQSRIENCQIEDTAIGSVTPAAGTFTTLTTSSTVTLSGGTANGVAYLNGSKVLTTGSALVFDGTNLGVGVSPSVGPLHAYGSTNAAIYNRLENATDSTTSAALHELKVGTKVTQFYMRGSSHSSTEWGLYSDLTASPFKLWNNNAVAMTVDSSGNVGIGVSPNEKCTVDGALSIKDGMTAPSATSGYAKIYVDTADGDLKVIFGDGTVKTIVVDT